MALFFWGARNIASNKKLFPYFHVCDNDAITKQSLPPNSGACKIKYSLKNY